MSHTYLLQIKFPIELKEQVELALYQSGQTSFQEIDHSEMAEQESAACSTGEFICYFETLTEANSIQSSLCENLPRDSVTIELGSIETQNWQDRWKEYAKPISISDSLHVVPSFNNTAENFSGLVLTVDPEQAFGSGSHETTKLCLKFIERLTCSGSIKSCLDIGCGSGILSIAAKRLGVDKVIGVDLDQTIIETANKNARLNFAESCQFSTTNLDQLDCKFDLVVANILSSTIEQLWLSLLNCCHPDSTIVVSGILVEEVSALTDRLGISTFELLEEGEWAALMFSAKSCKA